MRWNGKTKICYYENELLDDFEESNSNIDPIRIDKDYKYEHNVLWNIAASIVYWIAKPLFFLYAKIKFDTKIKNKYRIKKYKKQRKDLVRKGIVGDPGYFVYGNHTQDILDVLLPTFVNLPSRVYVISNAKNVSMKGLKTLIPMLGSIPLPEDRDAVKNFLDTIERKIANGHVIAIYPEAHIWPFNTSIRNFDKASFRYPVKLNVPVFSETTTYVGDEKNVKVIVYIDGPFYPDRSLSPKEAQEKLRNEVYDAMQKRAKSSNVEVVKYLQKNV